MKRIFLSLLMAVFFPGCKDNKESGDEPLVKTAATTATTETKPQPYEFASSKYEEMGMANQKLFAEGRIDEWANQFAEGAVFRWSGGDSVVGKAAILEYWKKRRSEVLKDIRFSEQVWLPVKVNPMPEAKVTAGDWLLSWFRVETTLTNQKRLTYRVHQAIHFDASGKVDRVSHYADQWPVKAALGAN